MRLGADVVVVGAGPGGAAVARQLAAAGADVLLLDRMTFPRNKVCGDGLTPRAIAALERLGVWERCASIATPVHELTTIDLVTGARQAGPLPSRVDGVDHGATVPRRRLDEVIRRHAIAAGARFAGGVDVRGTLRDHDGRVLGVLAVSDGARCEVRAPYVVAADGANGRLARTLIGRPPGVLRGVAVRQYWSASVPRAFTICVPIGRPGDALAGYGWVFPVGASGANVGVGLLGPAVVGRVRREYRRFLDRLRATIPWWDRAVPVSRLEGGVLAAGLRHDTATMQNVVFVGDAAGATNAFTGEGIAQALDSATAAAAAIAAHAHAGGNLADLHWRQLRGWFPESTRHVQSLPWIAERSGVFAREFWQVTSGAMRLVGRSVRTMTLDERCSRPAAGPGARAVSVLADRVQRRRPMLANFLRAAEREVGPLLDEGLETLRSTSAHGRTRSRHDCVLEMALAAIVASVAIADDTGDEPVDARGDAVDESAVWAVNAASLGIGDLLVAEALEIMAELPASASMALADATTQLLARLTARSVAAPAVRLQRRDVTALARRQSEGLAAARSHAA